MSDARTAVSTITVEAPPPELTERAITALELAQSYVGGVICQEAREAISVDLRTVKALLDEIEGERVKISKPLNEGLRAHNAFFKRLSDPVEQARAIMLAEAKAWDQEEERKRRAREAEAARAADAERKRLQDEAKAAEARGATETAHAIHQAALFVAPPPAPPPPKIAGESKREQWSAQVFDLRALARAAADDLVPVEYIVGLQPIKGSSPTLYESPTLNAQARALHAALAIPGVRASSESVLSLRTPA